MTPGAIDPIANTSIRTFQPFPSSFRGGATITTADVGTFAGRQFISSNPDHIAEIVVGSGPGMFATVNVYNAVPLYPVLVNTFRPISPAFRGGVSVSTLYGVPAAADAILVAAGVGGGSTVNTFVGVNKIKSAAFAAFYGTSANRSPVYTAAIDASNIFSVQGSSGKINGVNKNTNPNGGTSSTLVASKSFEPPLRIGILRR